MNPVVMTEVAFRKKLGMKDRFISRVARERKIVLVGDPREFGEFMADRTT